MVTRRMANPGNTTSSGALVKKSRAGGKHGAPLRGRRLGAQAQKTEAGRAEDSRCQAHGSGHDERRHDIRARCGAKRCADWPRPRPWPRGYSPVPLTDSVELRATRAKSGMEAMPTAMMTFRVPTPSAAIMPIASRKPGMAIRTSTNREISVSVRPAIEASHQPQELSR